MTQVVNLGEVIAQPKGSALVANASGGASTLTIDYAGEFSAGGGTLELNGVQMDYDSITEGAAQYDPDVINLTGTLANAASIGDWVSVAAGGQALVDYVAVCATDDGDEVRVPITDQQIPFYAVGVYDPAVPVFVSDDLQRLESAPGRTPALRGDRIVGIPYRTAESGERIELQVAGADNPAGQISFYTAAARENPALPGSITMQDVSAANIYLSISAAGLLDGGGLPQGFYSNERAEIRIESVDNAGSTDSAVRMYGRSIRLAPAEGIELDGPGVNISGFLTAATLDVGGLDVAVDANITYNLTVGATLSAPKSFQSGVEVSSSGAANVVRTLPIVFATPFVSPPVVTTTINVTASAALVRCWVGSVTTTGFTIYALREDNSGPYEVHWQATAPTQ